MSDVLSIWTIYDHPLDYDGFIARRFEVHAAEARPTTDIVTGTTLAEVRMKLPQDLFQLARQHDDDPNIVESWL